MMVCKLSAAIAVAAAVVGAATGSAPVFNPEDQRRVIWGLDIPLAYTNAIACGINTIVNRTPAWWPKPKDGKIPADEARELREFDRMCTEDGVLFVPYFLEVHNPALKERYPRMLRDGKPFNGNADANNPELKKYFKEFIEPYARFFADLPSVPGAEVSSEIRDKSRPSFTAQNAADFKAATGLDVPVEADERAAPHWSEIKGMPKDRVIDENFPVYAYYKWFWKTGDGWNDYQTIASEAFHRAFAEKGRTAINSYSGAGRVPPLWGSGGSVDLISQWLYAYPQPYNVGYMCSQLHEMAKGRPGQRVWASVQAIAYRHYTSPIEAQIENPPAWTKEWPNGQYITVPPDLMREALWVVFSRQVDVVQVHGWNSLWDGTARYGKNPKSYMYTNPEAKEVLKDCFLNVAVPLGPLFKAMPELPSPVAVLESAASSILSGRAPWDWTMPGFHYGVLAVGANLSPSTLYEEDIAANGVPACVKVLLCPNCDVLTRGAFEALKAFRARGGKIVGEATLCPALGKADAILPAFSRENTQTGDTADEVLPAGVSMPGRSLTGRQDDVNVTTTAGKIREIVTGFATPYLDVEGDHLLVHARSAGAAADCLFVVNDKRTYGDYVGPWKLVLEKGLPNRGVAKIRRAAAAVYDLVTHSKVAFESKEGVTSVPVSFETTQGKALLVCDRIPRQMELSVCEDGGKIAVEVRSSRSALTVFHASRITPSSAMARGPGPLTRGNSAGSPP